MREELSRVFQSQDVSSASGSSGRFRQLLGIEWSRPVKANKMMARDLIERVNFNTGD